MTKTDKVTITNEQLNLFCIVGKMYVSSAEDSVLKNAVEDMLDPALKKLKKVEKAIEKLRLKYAKKTSSKHIERDKHGNYQFTEEDSNKLTDEVDAMNEETVDLPYNIIESEEHIPTDLTYDQKRAFEGIVIPKKVRKFGDLKDDPKEEEDEKD